MDRKKLVGVDELAEILSVRKTLIYRLVESGQLPHYKVGSRLRFDPEEALLTIKMKRFFRDPRSEPLRRNESTGRFGTLFLLRRDINTCYGKTALWPGVITIFAGIDLLGKFYAGKDNRGEVTDRFKKFLADIADLDEEKCDFLYALRNSMVHSFGTYSNKITGKNKEYGNGRQHNFLLDQGTGVLLKYIGLKPGNTGEQVVYRIDIDELRIVFDKSIEKYYKRLKTNAGLKGSFSAMYSKYGEIHIWDS